MYNYVGESGIHDSFQMTHYNYVLYFVYFFAATGILFTRCWYYIDLF